MKIILASKSPRRKQLLEQMGIKFDVIPAVKDEIVEKEFSFAKNAKSISKQKAVEVFQKTEGDRMVIGSDTFVVCQNEIMGKPKDEIDAKIMLKLLSNAKHEVFTGLCVIISRNGKVKMYNTYEKVEVICNKLTDEIIDKYIATKEPMDKAGAYSMQGIAGVFVKKISGNPYSVIGLPTAKLYNIFVKEQIPFFNF